MSSRSSERPRLQMPGAGPLQNTQSQSLAFTPTHVSMHKDTHTQRSRTQSVWLCTQEVIHSQVSPHPHLPLPHCSPLPIPRPVNSLDPQLLGPCHILQFQTLGLLGGPPSVQLSPFSRALLLQGTLWYQAKVCSLDDRVATLGISL